MDNSVGKKSPPAVVDTPTAEELALLVGRRLSPPRVQAQELADRLNVAPSQLSAFERGRRPLPHGMGVKSYEQALADLKRAKRQGAAA